MILKIDRGNLELHKDNGSYVRTIKRGEVVDGDLNNDETLIVVTLNDGDVELYTESGSRVRTILRNSGTGATRARWQGDDIAVTLQNGHIEIRKENGTLIRTIR